MKISPSILACDFSKLSQEVVKVSKCGADYIHLDVMDGHFVPNISFGACVIKCIRDKTNLPFDVHLMISNPYDYIESFANSGADIITFHLESESNTLKTIEKIKSFNKKVGIAINPSTCEKDIIPYLDYIDLALIMTVNPGFGGQKFMKEQLEKTIFIKEKIRNKNLSTVIQIDGGVNTETINQIRKYPIDICVSGTCIFKSSNMKDTINYLKNKK